MIKKIRKKFCKKKPTREIVIVFPYNKRNNTLLIIEEYIHHYQEAFWKFVSGGIDKDGKTYLEHAIEELEEEISMQSDHIEHVYSARKVFGQRGAHYYAAYDPIEMEESVENPDTDIITNSKWVTEDEFQRMLDKKELMWDQATMTALQLFRQNKKHQ